MVARNELNKTVSGAKKPADETGDEQGLSTTGFITPKTLQQELKISPSTMYKWLSEKRLPPLYKVGPRAARFKAADIRSYMDNLTPHDTTDKM